MKHRSRARRNVAIVLILFTAAAILIAVARSAPPNTIPSESAETALHRADRENNGWYVLEQVLKDAPIRPKAAWGPLEDEPGFEGYYKAKPGSLGHLVGIGRKDDDPVLAEYLAGAEKLLPRIREVLGKPYLLLPPERVDPKSELFAGPWSNNEFLFATRDLFSLLLAHSYLVSRRPDGSSEAASVFRDSMELLDRMREGSVTNSVHVSPESVFQTLQCLKPDDQRETLRWALEMQSRTRPSRETIATDLRRFKTWLDQMATHGSLRNPMQAIKWIQHRNAFLRHSNYAFETAHLNAAEYERLMKNDPVLREFTGACYGYGPHSNPQMNTWWNGTMNGAITMLAIEIHRHDHGEFPESLEALTPEYLTELPRDPSFHEVKPFNYQREGSGYRLVTNERREGYVRIVEGEAK